MRHLARSGLITRAACYNTVRNITGFPLAGDCGTEAFDITPYARAATEFLMRKADLAEHALVRTPAPSASPRRGGWAAR
jgi:sulfite reductase beta subunit-like hemoprotein